MKSEPANQQMQRARHGQDGASPLICVSDGPARRPREIANGA